MKFKKILLSISAIITCFGMSAENSKYSHFVSVGGGADYLLNAMNIYDNLIDSYTTFHAGAGWGVSSLPSGDYFDYAFNYPEYGVKASYTRAGGLQFKNNSSLGDFYNIQGFFKPNFYRNDYFSIGPLMNLGLTYTNKTWDPAYNYNNKYVGTPVLVYLSVGMEAGFRIGRSWKIAAQVAVSHRSNGMIRVPNWGINNIEASLALHYHIQPMPRFAREGRPDIDFERKWLYDLYVTGGVHACDSERGIVQKYTGRNEWVKSYARLNIGTLVSYRYHPVFATGIGADIFYTGNWKRLEECSRLMGGNDKCCPIYAGLYIQQTFFYRHLEFGIGFGAYVFKKLGPEDSKYDYERVSLKYTFETPGIFTGVAFRAHRFDRSDTIELMLGKRF